MFKKITYLTIGQIAELANTTVKSLRYYEKIGLLAPRYTNPENNYRYYTFDQVYFINLLQFCVGMDIPLKELTRFKSEGNTIDFEAMLDYGKSIANEKISLIQKSLSFIEMSKQAISTIPTPSTGTSYTRHLREKLLYVMPYDKNISEGEFVKLYQQMQKKIQSFRPSILDRTESGIYYERFGNLEQFYLYVEISAKIPELGLIKKIPAGTFRCYQSNSYQIHNAPKIFPELYAQNERVIAMETELFPNKIAFDNLIKEIRCLSI